MTEVVSNGGRMITLEKWSLMEGKWSFYGGGQFNVGRMVVTEVTRLKEGE